MATDSNAPGVDPGGAKEHAEAEQRIAQASDPSCPPSLRLALRALVHVVTDRGPVEVRRSYAEKAARRIGDLIDEEKRLQQEQQELTAVADILAGMASHE